MIPNVNARIPQRGRGDNGLAAEQVRTFADLEGAGFSVKAQFASAAAWSPNPNNPPFYVDLPVRNGEVNSLVVAKWAANAPLALADQYIGNLRRMKAIAIDAGDMDEPIATNVRTLHAILDVYRLAHTFEIYEGNHVNRISERVAKRVLPFFASNLESPRSSSR